MLSFPPPPPIFSTCKHYAIDKSHDDEINVDLRTSGFDNKALSVDACAVCWEHELFYLA